MHRRIYNPVKRYCASLDFQSCETLLLCLPPQNLNFKKKTIVRLVVESSYFVTTIQNIARRFHAALIGVFRTDTKSKDAFALKEYDCVPLLYKVIDLIF